MRLPQLQARPQNAERPSQATVRPTDLGLGAVAQDVGQWAEEVQRTRVLEEEVQRAEDDKAIEPLVTAAQEAFETKFAESGALWDGTGSGFAKAQLAQLDADIAPVRAQENLTSGQRDALERRLSQYREATGQRAIQFESQKRGRWAGEQQAARETTAVAGVMADYTTQFGAAKAERDAAYDGSTPDYTSGLMGDHDRVSAELIAAAPETMRPRLMQTLAAQRLTLQAQAMDFEARGEQAYVAGQAKATGDSLINAVLSSPTMYDTAIGTVDQTVAALPASARPAARAGLLDGLTEAYVTGLVTSGEQDRALTLLNGGSLDSRLRPDTKARLLTQATRKSEELDVNDWMARLRTQQGMEDNVASIGATGVSNGMSVAEVASTLGPREAAAYQLEIEKAEGLHASLGGFAQMTAAQIRAQVAGLAPQPGQDGFADAQTAYMTASRAAEAEIKAREDDAAAWGLKQAPTLTAALQALGSGDQAAARRAAGGYARGQLTLQETAGIAVQDRRILPKSAAAGIVAAQVNNGDEGAGLRGLGQAIAAFGAPQGASGATVAAASARQMMVINELKAAGADNGDIAAALDLADNPVLLGRYVAADRGGALAALKPKERDDIHDAVASAMGPYLRSFQGMPVSTALTGGRMLVAERLAAEQMARRGGSLRDAAREAATSLTDRYRFVGPQGWRMPANLATGRASGPGMQFGQTLAQRGTARVMANLTRDNGAGFYAPAQRGDGLTETQRRERYADSIATNGRWMTTPDDAGLVLMHRSLDGRWTPALDRGGQPIQRPWSQLIDAGRDRPAGQRTAGGGPRGIRNHNPGNIEARANNRWQGQTGSDGRFATFASPEHGLRALSRDLGTKMGRGLTSVRSILTAYAPPGENNTAAYISAVSRALNVDPNAPLDASDVRLRAGLMGAIIQHENGDQPYATALIQEAARQGMRR